MAGQVVIKMVGENADLRAKLGQTTKEVAKLERQLEKTKSKSHNAFGGLKDSVASTIPGLGKLKGKFEEAGHAQGGFTSKIEGSVGSLGGLSAGIAGVGAAAAVGLAAFSDFAKEAVSDTLDLAGATKKLSNETGFDVQTSSAWVSLAKERGIGIQKLSQGFSSLSKAMYAASHGGAKMADLLDSVGVSQAAIQKGDLGNAIGSIADSFQQMSKSNKSGEVAIALKLFGKGGKDLIPILNQGSAGIKEMQGDMEALGLTLDKKTMAAFIKLKPEMRSIKGAFEGIKIQLGSWLIPRLEKAARAVAKLIMQIAKHKPVTGGLGKAFLTLVQIFKVTMTVLNVLGGVYKTVFSYMANIVGIFTSLFQAKWARMWGYIKQTAAQVFRVITTPYRLVFTFLVGIAGSIASRVWGAMRGALSAIGRFGSGVYSSVRNALGGIVGYLGGIVGRIGGLGARVGSALYHGVVNAVRGIGGAVSYIFGGVVGIIKSQINHAIDAVNGAIGAVNSVASHIPGVGKIGKIPHLASGGIVTQGRVALIGEDGPEMVLPLGRKHRREGSALLAQANGIMGGGGSNTFVVNNYGNQLDERALAARLAWQMQTRTA